MEGGVRMCLVMCYLTVSCVNLIFAVYIASEEEIGMPTHPSGVRADALTSKPLERKKRWLVCTPCWEGEGCQHYSDYYAPRFLVHATTVVLSPNDTGVVYEAWSTDEDLGLTCPLGPGYSARCPCAAVAYQLFAPPGDHHFQLDSVTGILTRNTSMTLEAGKTYNYKIMVQSIPLAGQSKDLYFDLLDLKVYVRPEFILKIPWS